MGFIIAKLGMNLFIIDQHAADEKYNYENLKQTTVLKTQQLLAYVAQPCLVLILRFVRPEEVNLSAVDEMLVLENLPMFQKNGFAFVVDSVRPA